MNKYFYKVIIKNKFTKLLAMVIVFICVIVTLQLRDDVQNLDVDDYIYMYKSNIIDTQADFRREHYYGQQDTSGMGTEEGNVAWLSYLKWSLKTQKEICMKISITTTRVMTGMI